MQLKTDREVRLSPGFRHRDRDVVRSHQPYFSELIWMSGWPYKRPEFGFDGDGMEASWRENKPRQMISDLH